MRHNDASSARGAQQPRLPPDEPAPFKWTTFNDMPRLVCGVSTDPKLRALDIDTGDYMFYPDVLSGTATIPTLTTPAPTEAGRPPPRSRTPRNPEAMQRWQTDNQQFAPWHYEERTILRHSQDATRWLQHQ
eukprot:16441133-Heterocapsa_arctica.AAC.1